MKIIILLVKFLMDLLDHLREVKEAYPDVFWLLAIITLLLVVSAIILIRLSGKYLSPKPDQEKK